VSAQGPTADSAAALGENPAAAPSLASLWRSVQGLVAHRLRLLFLELEQARQALLQTVALAVLATVLAATLWLAFWVGLVGALWMAGVAPWLIWVLVTGVNALALGVTLWRVRRVIALLSLPATQRCLLSNKEQPLGEKLAEAVAADDKAAQAPLAKRIERLEQDIHDGDDQVRVQSARWMGHWRQQLGRRLAMGASAASLALLLWRLRPKKARHEAHAAASHRGRRARGSHWLGWVGHFPMVWPFLPVPWRQRLWPAMSVLTTVAGLPAVAPVKAPRPPPVPAQDIDLEKFQGRWCEVLNLPARSGKSGTQVTANYVPSPDGLFRIVRVSQREGGRKVRSFGVARVVAQSGQAKWQVSFASPRWRWLPWVWKDQWILLVDPAYQLAVVGSPDYTSLSLMSRVPDPSEGAIEAMLAFAKNQGYDVSEVRAVPPEPAQSAPPASQSGGDAVPVAPA
jgi:apolipoprotein D and lipocalin family protein